MTCCNVYALLPVSVKAGRWPGCSPRYLANSGRSGWVSVLSSPCEKMGAWTNGPSLIAGHVLLELGRFSPSLNEGG
ncbi:hypothetical protein [Vibrio ostreicida]|uniref:hypothetical protein n=1 Tax=Vibrio ostreicida TaxID=526588 RepID=UPI0015C3F6CA|nr:hypothetical protein [Vibrio ostreicida]